jgi:hypothetical protein
MVREMFRKITDIIVMILVVILGIMTIIEIIKEFIL